MGLAPGAGAAAPAAYVCALGLAVDRLEQTYRRAFDEPTGQRYHYAVQPLISPAALFTTSLGWQSTIPGSPFAPDDQMLDPGVLAAASRARSAGSISARSAASPTRTPRMRRRERDRVRASGSRWVEQAGERTYSPSLVHGHGASGQWLIRVPASCGRRASLGDMGLREITVVTGRGAPAGAPEFNHGGQFSVIRVGRCCWVRSGLSVARAGERVSVCRAPSGACGAATSETVVPYRQMNAARSPEVTKAPSSSITACTCWRTSSTTSGQGRAISSW
jgi:hypothetical protein